MSMDRFILFCFLLATNCFNVFGQQSSQQTDTLSCLAMVCNFESGNLCNYQNINSPDVTVKGAWKQFEISRKAFRNRATGVRYPAEGSVFASTYLKAGDKALLESEGSVNSDGTRYVFPLSADRMVKFKVYKVADKMELKGCCDSIQNCPFSTEEDVKITDFNSWKNGSFVCKAGTQKVLFYGINHGLNEGAIGLDDIQLYVPAEMFPDKTEKNACFNPNGGSGSGTNSGGTNVVVMPNSGTDSNSGGSNNAGQTTNVGNGQNGQTNSGGSSNNGGNSWQPSPNSGGSQTNNGNSGSNNGNSGTNNGGMTNSGNAGNGFSGSSNGNGGNLLPQTGIPSGNGGNNGMGGNGNNGNGNNGNNGNGNTNGNNGNNNANSGNNGGNNGMGGNGNNNGNNGNNGNGNNNANSGNFNGNNGNGGNSGNSNGNSGDGNNGSNGNGNNRNGGNNGNGNGSNGNSWNGNNGNNGNGNNGNSSNGNNGNGNGNRNGGGDGGTGSNGHSSNQGNENGNSNTDNSNGDGKNMISISFADLPNSGSNTRRQNSQ